MPRYGFTDRETENASKLRSFEAAEQREIRSDRAREKMDFDQQYKLGEAERRAQESAMRATAAMERSAIMEQQLQLQKDAAALKLLKEETNLQDIARATQDKIGFIKATRDLREDDEQFDQKLSDAMAAFPNAQKDEFVQKRLGWLTDQRKGHLERKRLEPVIKNMDVKGATVDGVTYQAKA